LSYKNNTRIHFCNHSTIYVKSYYIENSYILFSKHHTLHISSCIILLHLTGLCELFVTFFPRQLFIIQHYNIIMEHYNT
jgi:uncharacterized membrane protein YwaF